MGCRYAETEELFLDKYLDWAFNVVHYDGDRTRTEFYHGLIEELRRVFMEVSGKKRDAFAKASRLGL